jgi:hypothetical protein
MVRFRRGRSDHPNAQVVHRSRREPPGDIQMLDRVRRPSNDRVSPDESPNTLHGQVALPHVDAVDGGAAMSRGKIDIDTIIDDDRHQVAHSVGHLDHKSETLSG